MQSQYYLVNFDPIALSIGPVSIHWYGVMYLLAFVSFWWIQSRIAGSRPWWGWSREDVGDFMFYGMLGVILGGRLGYVLFYGWQTLLQDPLYVLRIWDGGMSFHGGLIGVIAAMGWYGRKSGRSFWQVADFVAPVVPLGLALGRIGNFIGGELWGRLTDVPWAMIFPCSLPPGVLGQRGLEVAWREGALDSFSRHPSQLYQAGLEGLTLFALLLAYSARPRPQGAISGAFLAGYGMFRLVGEFFREPDAHLGFLAGGWLTMGMLLSLPMILLGVIFMATSYRRARATAGQAST
jgi:phosphatidylglycerol:prolipoprotein diacylglycerol transferase